MRRRTPPAATVPADLRTFDAARWIRDGIDKGDPFLLPLARRLTHEALFTDPYATEIVARARWRQALTDAVGQAAADRWLWDR